MTMMSALRLNFLNKLRKLVLRRALPVLFSHEELCRPGPLPGLIVVNYPFISMLLPSKDLQTKQAPAQANTNTILGIPYYNYSIMCPETLF